MYRADRGSAMPADRNALYQSRGGQPVADRRYPTDQTCHSSSRKGTTCVFGTGCLRSGAAPSGSRSCLLSAGHAGIRRDHRHCRSCAAYQGRRSQDASPWHRYFGRRPLQRSQDRVLSRHGQLLEQAGYPLCQRVPRRHEGRRRTDNAALLWRWRDREIPIRRLPELTLSIGSFQTTYRPMSIASATNPGNISAQSAWTASARRSPSPSTSKR